MKPTRERAVAALRAALELCDEIDVIEPGSDYERGLVRMSYLAHGHRDHPPGQAMTGELFLDRDREVWRRVHSGDLVRLTIGGYISPPRRMRWVDEQYGPLVELVPAAPTTSPTPLTTDDRERVMHTIRVYQDEAGGWRWQRRAGNGEIISSGESHTRRSDALRAVRGANLDNEWTFDRDTVRGDDE